MKKFIFFVIIPTFILAETTIVVKKSIISGVNYFLPDFLRIDKEKSLIKTSLSYDTLSHDLNAHLSVRLRLPELIIKKTKSITTYNNKSQEKSLQIKLRPYLRLKSGKIKAFMGFHINYKDSQEIFKGVSNNFYYYPFENYWEESLSFLVSYKNNSTSLTFSTNSDDVPTISYTYGIYHIFISKKHELLNSGLEFSGETHQYPVIYSYKLFLKYRHTLFHTKRMFYDITPYLLYSKEYDFKLKPALNVSIYYEF